MEHLGIEHFSVMGMCTGGAFIMELIEQAPEQIASAVAMQPIGFDGNRDEFRGIFDEWRSAIDGDHPEATDEDWESFWSNLYGCDDLSWSVPDHFVPTITTSLLVLQRDDVYDPKSVSLHLAAIVPSATLVERWKVPADQPAARARLSTTSSRRTRPDAAASCGDCELTVAGSIASSTDAYSCHTAGRQRIARGAEGISSSMGTSPNTRQRLLPELLPDGLKLIGDQPRDPTRPVRE